MRLGAVPLIEVKYAKPAVDQIQIVPVRVDGVVVGGPRQALVGEGRVGGRELGIAVGRQIDAGESSGRTRCKGRATRWWLPVSSP